jgi:3-mercaptopyruvate sulfurtransferase SseA
MKERKFLKRNFEHIQANVESRKETLLDVRSVKEFNSGHIPNSKNIPYPDFFDRTTGLLKSKEELAKSNYFHI